MRHIVNMVYVVHGLPKFGRDPDFEIIGIFTGEKDAKALVADVDTDETQYLAGSSNYQHVPMIVAQDTLIEDRVEGFAKMFRNFPMLRNMRHGK